MLHSTAACRNTYMTRSMTTPPISVIRTGPKWWTDPDRMVRHKLMYFTLGIDQQPLRRTAVIAVDQYRQHMCKPAMSTSDTTGYKRARQSQMTTWYRRIQYQEYYLQHMFTRHVWGLLRMYPANHTKIAGKADDGYAGYDSVPFHRYNRTPLPFPAREIYERRK